MFDRLYSVSLPETRSYYQKLAQPPPGADTQRLFSSEHLPALSLVRRAVREKKPKVGAVFGFLCLHDDQPRASH